MSWSEYFFFVDPLTVTLVDGLILSFLDGVPLSPFSIRVPPVTLADGLFDAFIFFPLVLIWEFRGCIGSTLTTLFSNAGAPCSFFRGCFRGRPLFRFSGTGVVEALSSSSIISPYASDRSLIFPSNFSIRDSTAQRAWLLPSSLYKCFDSLGFRAYPPSSAACCLNMVMLVAPGTLPIRFCAIPGCLLVSSKFAGDPSSLVACVKVSSSIAAASISANSGESYVLSFSRCCCVNASRALSRRSSDTDISGLTSSITVEELDADGGLLAGLDFCCLRAKSESLLRPFVEDMKESGVDLLDAQEFFWLQIRMRPAAEAALRLDGFMIVSICIYSGW
mmetsp:Transcript_33896/g.81973  ORF Transcript_33896/g.81973 Transcript_33896/m.81973 type:complete len:334 (-) Transcript_33896:64-1065(-)